MTCGGRGWWLQPAAHVEAGRRSGATSRAPPARGT
ncbi:unnamed protein product [Spirodela intermedia]|uniref:Uncharacterized protein n=1 Tax=Spirodela intermedia TaxID=51605 RepID=A0A7I8J317_SPIIN|nr:unnamed protein product [Spirodela intermedia]CAA6664507.1 unnamed protein product [Spirodela intermedia]